jgi:hypothetical protein
MFITPTKAQEISFHIFHISTEVFYLRQKASYSRIWKTLIQKTLISSNYHHSKSGSTFFVRDVNAEIFNQSSAQCDN